MSLDFQKTLMQVLLDNITKFDATILKTKDEYVNIMPTESGIIVHQLRLKTS